MDTYDIGSAEARRILIQVLGTKRCVPFLGAGFSSGERAKNGSVPSVAEFSSIMVNELIKQPVYADKKSWLEKQGFFKLADYYWKNAISEDRDKLLIDRFTNVRVSSAKKQFLNCGWHNIVTLNIDDGIERANSKFKTILPHSSLKSHIYKLNDLLVKVHGDAFKDASASASSPQVIFSRKSYWDSASSNKDVLRLFSTNWKENNILFIGCSLTDEFDLLYSLSSPTEDPYPDTYRIFFTDRKTADDVDFMTTLELDYKITHILVVDDWDDIYKMCVSYFPVDSSNGIEKLEEFSFSRFQPLRSTFENVIEHLLQTDTMLQKISHFELLLPEYLIERKITRGILSSVHSETFTLVEGRRFSGQSSLLKKLAVRLQPAKVYFFPSGTEISIATLEAISFIENSYFLFDGRTLNHGHLDWLLHSEHVFNKNNNKVVIVSSTTDGGLSTPLIDRYGEKISFRLKQELDVDETKSINAELDEVGISRIVSGASILDSIHSIARRYDDFQSNIFPRHSEFTDMELHFLLLLFTNEKVSTLESAYVGFSGTDFNGFAKKCSSLVLQEENTVNPTSRGRYNILLNCKPWCASIFNQYELVHSTDECQELVNSLIKKLDNSMFGKGIFIQLIRVDNLRILFPKQHGYFIGRLFEGLRFMFNNSPDFWLQWGKAVLYTSRDIDALSDSVNYVKKAIADGSESTKRNATHTLALISGKLAELSHFNSVPANVMAIKSYANAIRNDRTNTRYVDDLKESSTLANKQVKMLLRQIARSPAIEYLIVKDDVDDLRRFFLDFHG